MLIKRLLLYLFLIWICLFLYLFNNLWLKLNSDGWLLSFSVSHFNDFLAPVVMLSVANLALLAAGRSWRKLWQVLLLTLMCGLFWESGGIFDRLDFFAYLAGGLLFWVISKAALKEAAP